MFRLCAAGRCARRVPPLRPGTKPLLVKPAITATAPAAPGPHRICGKKDVTQAVSLMWTAAEPAVRKPGSGTDDRQALEDVIEEPERTTGLIESILAPARAGTGRAHIQCTPADFAALLLQAGGQAQKLASQAGISFPRQRFAPRSRIAAGAGTLRCLLLILLGHAAKHTPRRGTAPMNADRSGRRPAAEIRDTGAGTAEQGPPQIFERFCRADSSCSGDSGGAGPGLSIAKRTGDVHQDVISVESAVDRGRLLRVELPSERR